MTAARIAPFVAVAVAALLVTPPALAQQPGDKHGFGMSTRC
jgi:hypothetical protein